MHPQLNTPAPSAPSVSAWFETFNAAVTTPMNGDLKAVLLGVLHHADSKGTDVGNARPGVKRLTEYTGLGRSTVLRKLDELVKAGWLVVTTQGGGRSATTYRVAVPSVQIKSSPRSGTAGVPEAGRVQSRERDTTNASPTQNQQTLITPAPPREGESSLEEKGDRIPKVVLDAVQAVARSRNLDTMEALEETVAPVYGRAVAEWLVSLQVNYGQDLLPADESRDEWGRARYMTGWKVRELLNTAHAQGVWVMNLPKARNTGVDESLVDQDLLDTMTADFEAAQSRLRSEALDAPESAQEDETPRESVEDVNAAPAPLQAPARAMFQDETPMDLEENRADQDRRLREWAEKNGMAWA